VGLLGAVPALALVPLKLSAYGALVAPKKLRNFAASLSLLLPSVN
jgi:hypothetical protein